MVLRVRLGKQPPIPSRLSFLLDGVHMAAGEELSSDCLTRLVTN